MLFKVKSIAFYVQMSVSILLPINTSKKITVCCFSRVVITLGGTVMQWLEQSPLSEHHWFTSCGLFWVEFVFFLRSRMGFIMVPPTDHVGLTGNSKLPLVVSKSERVVVSLICLYVMDL